jgi:hypothetical protein
MTPFTYTQAFELKDRKTGKYVGRYEKRIQAGKDSCLMYGMAGAIKDAQEWARKHGNMEDFKLSKAGVYMD